MSWRRYRSKFYCVTHLLSRPYVSHTYLFRERLQQQAAHEPQRGSLDEVRKPPDAVMTILEFRSLHLSLDGLVKAIACDQRFQKAPWLCLRRNSCHSNLPAYVHCRFAPVAPDVFQALARDFRSRSILDFFNSIDSERTFLR